MNIRADGNTSFPEIQPVVDVPSNKTPSSQKIPFKQVILPQFEEAPNIKNHQFVNLTDKVKEATKELNEASVPSTKINKKRLGILATASIVSVIAGVILSIVGIALSASGVGLPVGLGLLAGGIGLIAGGIIGGKYVSSKQRQINQADKNNLSIQRLQLLAKDEAFQQFAANWQKKIGREDLDFIEFVQKSDGLENIYGAYQNLNQHANESEEVKNPIEAHYIFAEVDFINHWIDLTQQEVDSHSSTALKANLLKIIEDQKNSRAYLLDEAPLTFLSSADFSKLQKLRNLEPLLEMDEDEPLKDFYEDLRADLGLSHLSLEEFNKEIPNLRRLYNYYEEHLNEMAAPDKAIPYGFENFGGTFNYLFEKMDLINRLLSKQNNLMIEVKNKLAQAVSPEKERLALEHNQIIDRVQILKDARTKLAKNEKLSDLFFKEHHTRSRFYQLVDLSVMRFNAIDAVS